MVCKDCCEKLSDFLLDELPEMEAVLVQEHLNLCPDCMSTYKELKGTGRLLEAVPALRPAPASPQFGRKVLHAARLESEKIIKSLPPEKRLRMEARHASRANLEPAEPAAPVSQRRSTFGRSKAVLGILILGTAAAAFILFYPGFGGDRAAGPVGTLSACVGKAEQFYQRSGERWSAATEGTIVNAEDEFATREDGLIRIDLEGGGSVLMGPSSEVKFRRPAAKREAQVINLASGSLGLELPAAAGDTASASASEQVIRTETVDIRVKPECKLYVQLTKDNTGQACAVRVAQGRVRVLYGARKDQETEVKAEEGVTFNAGQLLATEPLPSRAAIPAWRSDLLNSAELAALLAPGVRIVERKPGGLLVECSCGFGHAGGLSAWSSNTPQRALTLKDGGLLMIPSGAKFTLLPPMLGPITVEAVLSAETAKDASFAFSVLDTEIRRVSVDVDHEEALLQVREAARTTAVHLPCHPGAVAGERVRLVLAEGNLEGTATLSTSAGSAKPLTVSKAPGQAGGVWFSALRENLVVEGIRITGVVPREWLNQRQKELKP